jgi:hypothetical protein
VVVVAKVVVHSKQVKQQAKKGKLKNEAPRDEWL